MGTRSLTHVKGDVWDAEKEPATLVTVYRQMDGYPTCHGKALKEFLDDRTIVNGYGSNTPSKASNGMGCLAASLIGEMKADSGIGGIYLYAPDSTDVGEEWVYTIYQNGTRDSIGNELCLKVYAVYRDKIAYDGPVSDFDPEAAEALVYDENGEDLTEDTN